MKPSKIGNWKSKKQISINIGEYHASKKPVVIHTLLGSCVSVCLIDEKRRIGGMNHILLPGRADMRHFDEPARYGINAMELLINRILALGGNRRQLAAKVFGGGNVISSIPSDKAVGKKNVDFILEFLRLEGIRILKKDVGGTDTRKIYFHTDTGKVYLKRISSIYQTHLAKEEALKLKRIRKAAGTPGEITLFDEK